MKHGPLALCAALVVNVGAYFRASGWIFGWIFFLGCGLVFIDSMILNRRIRRLLKEVRANLDSAVAMSEEMGASYRDSRVRRPPHRCPGPNCTERDVSKWVEDGVFHPRAIGRG